MFDIDKLVELYRKASIDEWNKSFKTPEIGPLVYEECDESEEDDVCERAAMRRLVHRILDIIILKIAKHAAEKKTVGALRISEEIVAVINQIRPDKLE